jgi:ankyrin repeat protein
MDIMTSSDAGLPQPESSLAAYRRGTFTDAWGFQEPPCGGRSSDEGEGDEAGSALNAFFLNYRFNGATDYGPRGDGLPPLICAAFEGSTAVVRALLEARADPNRGYQGRTVISHLGLIPGGNLPLQVAVASRASSQATIRALLRHGADLSAAVGALRVSPLAGGVYYECPHGIRALYHVCAKLGMRLDLERGLENLGWSPLLLAAYSSQPETVRALVEIGCDRGAVGDNGYSVLQAACDNPQMDLETLELLWHNGDGVDINQSVQPRTAFWHALTAMSTLVAKCGGAIPVVGGLAKAFADVRGSTPLHGAAKAGRLDIVAWLMERGAARSLHVKTASGATPVAFAERAGHYAVVGFLNDQLATSRRELADPTAAGDYDA